MNNHLAKAIYDSMKDAAKARTSIKNIEDVLDALSEWDDVISLIGDAYFNG